MEKDFDNTEFLWVYTLIFFFMIPRVFFWFWEGEYRVREWMKVVEMEKSDLGRAMDVVSVVIAKWGEREGEGEESV